MTTVFGLDLRGRRVVVAGGGPVATRRVVAWLGGGADLLVVAPSVSDEVRDLATQGRIEWRERPVAEGDLAGAWLVMTATGDEGVDADVARWASTGRIWCVDASGAAGGSARVAATAVHGDVALGVVSLGDADPRRVSAVRDALSRHLATGGVDLRRRRPGRGRVLLVGSGPGAPDLMTLRAYRALAEADVIVADRLGARGALDGVPPNVEVIDVGKAPGHHAVPQEDINALVVGLAVTGKTVVRFKGGDPFVFGRGGEEAQACRAAGIACEVVPGISSAFAVPALAGIPVTHRGTSPAVLVTSGHDGADPVALAAIAGGTTVVVLMGVATLERICSTALDGGARPDTPVAIIERGSEPSERVTRATLETAAAAAASIDVRAPAVIVIGEVARPDLLTTPDRAAAE